MHDVMDEEVETLIKAGFIREVIVHIVCQMLFRLRRKMVSGEYV